MDASTSEPGHSELDTLREKHPAPGAAVESAFLLCDVLPLLTDLDITAEYVEHGANQIQGSAGPSGSAALQWRGIYFSMVFQVHVYGMQLLRWPIIWLMNLLIGRLYVPCPALMASHLIALDKCPGVHPIGIGDALCGVLYKVVALATCSDLEEACGIA